jgi:hypothetical protein
VKAGGMGPLPSLPAGAPAPRVRDGLAFPEEGAGTSSTAGDGGSPHHDGVPQPA